MEVRIFVVNLIFSPLLIAEDGSKIFSIFDFLMQNAVGISILFIFLSALLGFFLRARSVDKCLKDFSGFSVTIEDTSIHKGILHMYHTGMELEYKEPISHKEEFTEYTQIFYSTEYSNIKAIYRFQDELSAKNCSRREKSIKQTYKPGFFRRMRRNVSNIMGTFRDAFTQSLSLIMGQMKKAQPGSQIMTQDKHLQSMGKELVEHTGNVYDPILEKLIGRKVVVHIIAEEKKFYGVFKEYSKNFIQLLNIKIPQSFQYKIYNNEKKAQKNSEDIPNIVVLRENKNFIIKNYENIPVFISRAGKEDDLRKVERFIDSQGQLQLETKNLLKNPGDVQHLIIEIVRPADVILPRSVAFVRHGADQQKQTWKQALQADFQTVWQIGKNLHKKIGN